MRHLAKKAIDVTYSVHPIFPRGVKEFDVSKYIVTMLYNPDDYAPTDFSIDRLIYGSAHTARVSEQTDKLNAFTKELRRHLAAGRYVIVRGWKPPVDIAWHNNAVLSLKGPLEQHVEYQGEYDATLLTITLNPYLQTLRSG